MEIRKEGIDFKGIKPNYVSRHNRYEQKVEEEGVYKRDRSENGAKGKLHLIINIPYSQTVQLSSSVRVCVSAQLAVVTFLDQQKERNIGGWGGL